MSNWQAIAAPPTMRDAARVLCARRQERVNSVFEKVLDHKDKYYFSSSEAHSLDRRIDK